MSSRTARTRNSGECGFEVFFCLRSITGNSSRFCPPVNPGRFRWLRTAFDEEFLRREAANGPWSAGVTAGAGDVVEASPKLVLVEMDAALHARVFEGAVHPRDLPVFAGKHATGLFRDPPNSTGGSPSSCDVGWA